MRPNQSRFHTAWTRWPEQNFSRSLTDSCISL